MSPQNPLPAGRPGPADERVLTAWGRAADARSHARMARQAAWGWGLFALSCGGIAVDEAGRGDWLFVLISALTCLTAAWVAVQAVRTARAREELAGTYDEMANTYAGLHRP